MAEDKPLTKQDLMDVFNDVIPPLATAIGEIQQNVGKLQKDVGEIQQNVGKLQKDVGEIQQNVGKLQKDVGGVQQNVGKLQKDVGNLQQDVSGIKKELLGIKKELAKKPDEDRVRQIVREELDDSLPHKTFRIMEVK